MTGECQNYGKQDDSNHTHTNNIQLFEAASKERDANHAPNAVTKRFKCIVISNESWAPEKGTFQNIQRLNTVNTDRCQESKATTKHQQHKAPSSSISSFLKEFKKAFNIFKAEKENSGVVVGRSRNFTNAG